MSDWAIRSGELRKMPMITDFAITVISSATVSAALSALLLWFTKTWVSERLKNAIKAEYDTKLESHKAQLKAKSDVEIEQLKSALSMAASQRNTAFSQLQTRRVDVIANTYSKLRKLHDCVANYVKPFEPAGDRSREERRNDAIEASADFSPYYSQNQIFLSREAAQAVQHVNQELIGITNKFIYTVDLQRIPDAITWVKITEQFNGSVKEAIEALEKQLRQLLGDTD
jgi:hypothetical protein